jgi:hypothetical protein
MRKIRLDADFRFDQAIRRLGGKPVPSSLQIDEFVKSATALVEQIGLGMSTVFREVGKGFQAASEVLATLGPREVVHACPARGYGAMECCGVLVFDLPMSDRVTTNPDHVTCGREPS